jgi:hypothetical protein
MNHGYPASIISKAGLQKETIQVRRSMSNTDEWNPGVDFHPITAVMETDGESSSRSVGHSLLPKRNAVSIVDAGNFLA